MPSVFLGKIDNSNYLLLRDHSIRLWRFMPSHDRLVYEIVTAGAKPRLYLIFIGCDFIKSGTVHKFVAPKIEPAEGGLITMSDGDEFLINYVECRVDETYELVSTAAQE